MSTQQRILLFFVLPILAPLLYSPDWLMPLIFTNGEVALGGVIGGVLSNMGSLSDKLSGVKTIHIDPATITLLATRAQALILALLQRGHAAQQTLSLQAADVIWPNSNLPGPLRRARSHSEWSALNGVKASKAESNRREAAQKLHRNLRRS